MKTIQVLLIIALATIGLVASVTPSLAASHSPVHSVEPYVLDEQPTPTPTPIIIHTDGDECSGGGC